MKVIRNIDTSEELEDLDQCGHAAENDRSPHDYLDLLVSRKALGKDHNQPGPGQDRDKTAPGTECLGCRYRAGHAGDEAGQDSEGEGEDCEAYGSSCPGWNDLPGKPRSGIPEKYQERENRRGR